MGPSGPFGAAFVAVCGQTPTCAALNKVELLPWDAWGAHPELGQTLSGGALAYFDEPRLSCGIPTHSSASCASAT